MHFNFSRKKKILKVASSPTKENYDSSFLQAISLFKKQRKKLGFSIDELANKTKISKNVLISIENGWRKYLPENTYLVSMIKILESILELESNSLNGLMIQNKKSNKLSTFQFNLITIDFFSTWHGNFLYILVILTSILFLNSKQHYLIPFDFQSNEPNNLIEKSTREIRIRPIKAQEN